MEDEPKKFFAKGPKALGKNKRAFWILLVGLGLLAFFAFIIQTPKKHSKGSEDRGVDPEQKNLYSKAQIESLIKEKTAEELEKKATKKSPPAAAGPKHKLNSPIAVYIKEEAKQGTRPVVQDKNKNLGIPTGAKVKAHLANAIFSFNVSSPVVAVTDEDVKKDEVVIVPKGTQLVGDAGIVKSRDRVNVKFSTMILPDGRELAVRAMALGLDGSGGVKGKVDKQYDKSFLRAVGETLLSGAALVVGTREQPLTLTDELRLNAARNLTDDARGALNNVKIEESITVESYTPILVFFLESV